MEALVMERICELRKVRQLYRTNSWATWPQGRKDVEVELRALLRLVRQHRREFQDYPKDASYHDWQAA